MGSDSSWTSLDLLERVRNGDEGAVRDLFSRYTERLTLLARSRLSPRLAARTDPEDVVLSAWRSFFVAAQAGRFSLRRSGDLWNLLASIAMHKLYRQARMHRAEKRAVGLEQSIDVSALAIEHVEPTPEEALALADELQAVMGGLDPFERRVLELRLQGETCDAIAVETERSERTIRRTLDRIRTLLVTRLSAARS